MNILDTFKKILNDKNKKIIACFIAFVIAIVNCYVYKKHKKIDDLITKETTIFQTLNNISEESNIDDIILNNDITRLNNKNNKSDFKTVLYDYQNAKSNKKMYELNNKLENLCLLILKSSIIDSLNIEINDIAGMKIENDMVHIKFSETASYLLVDNIIDKDIAGKEKTFRLAGEAKDITEILYKAQAHKFNSLEEVEEVNYKLNKFLYSKSTIKNNIIMTDIISFKYDKNLVKKLKK